jgi:hypothetical protein
MGTIEINGLTFQVEFEHDGDTCAPWEDGDGHGIVSDWTSRDKRAGELVLNSAHGSKRYYDYAATCKIALRDGWGHGDDVAGETKRQKAARATLADFEYLRLWCVDQWSYNTVIVTLLDENGDVTEICDTLCAVETYNDYHETVAREMAENLAAECGKTWGATTKSTYAYTQTGA